MKINNFHLLKQTHEQSEEANDVEKKESTSQGSQRDILVIVY